MGAVAMRRWFIFFFALTSLVVYDIVYFSDSVFHSSLQTPFATIFISLVTWRGYHVLHIISSKWSDMLVFGLFERKETTWFKNKARNLVQLLNNVKFLSFSWLNANMLTSTFSYNDGWRHPLLCMSVIE